MQIYLLRHGIAENGRPGLRDFDRPLTTEGREKLAKILRRARGAGASPSVILSSPLRRAVQTAEIAAEILEYRGTIVETRALVSEATPEEAWEEIRTRRDEPAILLASHEPLMSTMVAFLLDSPSLVVDMKKGAMVRIDCERFVTSPNGILKWMLTPSAAGA